MQVLLFGSASGTLEFLYCFSVLQQIVAAGSGKDGLRGSDCRGCLAGISDLQQNSDTFEMILRIAFLCSLCGLVAVAAVGEDIKMRDGRVYANAKVRIEGDSAVLIISTGIIRVPVSELPEDIQKRYAAEIEQGRQQVEAAKRVIPTPSAPPPTTPQTLKRRVKGGLIMAGMNATETATNAFIGSDKPWMLVGHDPGNTPDDTPLAGRIMLYRAGVYSDGVETIARYATTPEKAAALILADSQRRSDE